MSGGVRSWDWWLESLPELVWPAEGLGPWEPRAARALERAPLLRLLAREDDPAARARLRRVLGEPGSRDELERAARRAPRGAEARAWLAESVLDEDPARALRLLDGARGPAAALYRGAALMSLKRWKAAAAVFEGIPSALAALLAGAARLRAGEPAAALEALRGGADSAALHWLRAFACDRLGRDAEVRLNVERAMLRFSEIAFDPLLGAALRRENLRGGRCRPPTARTLALLSARRAGARAVWADVSRAETLRAPQFSRYAEAVPLLRRAAKRSPRSPWVWAYLGRGLDSVGDSAGAKRALDRAAELAPGCGWIRAWRGSWLLRHKSAAALAELARAAALIPGYPFARAWHGGALRRAGRLARAAAELELAVRLEPGYEWSFAELFQVRRQQRDWAAAAAMVTEAYEREMKFTWARRDDPEACARAAEELAGALSSRPRLALLRAWRAWLLLSLGRAPEALREALAAAAEGPAFAHAVAAEACEHEGDLERALAHYGRAVALRPCAAYVGARGAVLQRLGRAKAAVADLRRAVELNGTVARFQCALGAALLDLGRPRASLDALDRALGLDPGYGEARARRALAAARLAKNDVAACAELLKAVELGAELPPALLAATRRRMKTLARRALKGLGNGPEVRRLLAESGS
ncbi:MAG: hypothetical protein HYV14_04570 [Elusimicrobia bacterium]|nr:hypothetical protein [Elusimicrobiota bacterium]